MPRLNETHMRIIFNGTFPNSPQCFSVWSGPYSIYTTSTDFQHTASEEDWELFHNGAEILSQRH